MRLCRSLKFLLVPHLETLGINSLLCVLCATLERLARQFSCCRVQKKRNVHVQYVMMQPQLVLPFLLEARRGDSDRGLSDTLGELNPGVFS